MLKAKRNETNDKIRLDANAMIYYYSLINSRFKLSVYLIGSVQCKKKKKKTERERKNSHINYTFYIICNIAENDHRLFFVDGLNAGIN